MQKKYTIAVLGAGNMGTAVAQVIAKNGHRVNLWNHKGDLIPLKQIKKYRENKKYLSGVKLSKNIVPQDEIAKAVKKVNVVFLVVPSFCMELVVKEVSKYLEPKTICVDVSKGIDEKSLGLIPDVIKKNLPASLRKLVSTISGPAIANDMARGGFTAMNVASDSKQSIKLIKEIMESNNLKLNSSDDIIGIEVTGSFKNVYAIAMGLCDGLKLPMNTKAALLVLALKEISQLVKKMKGRPETVYGLAGLGDLIGTGLCASSRNRRFGELLAKGNNINKSLKKVGQVVEGISAAKVLHALSKRYKIRAPFAEMVYKVSSGKLKAREGMEGYLKSI